MENKEVEETIKMINSIQFIIKAHIMKVCFHIKFQIWRKKWSMNYKIWMQKNWFQVFGDRLSLNAG